MHWEWRRGRRAEKEKFLEAAHQRCRGRESGSDSDLSVFHFTPHGPNKSMTFHLSCFAFLQIVWEYMMNQPLIGKYKTKHDFTCLYRGGTRNNITHEKAKNNFRMNCNSVAPAEITHSDFSFWKMEAYGAKRLG